MVLCAAISPIGLVAQSTHISALAGSAPAPITEPMTGVIGPGLGSLWSDPTSSPGATGALFSAYRSSYSSIEMYHAVLAFTLGPRWSATYGLTEIRNLFDTSLTNQDPSLASLRAQAVWAGFDATVSRKIISAALGLAWAGDDNVGDVHTSTIARAHVRLHPPKVLGVVLGLHASKVIGGSLPTKATGVQWLDFAWEHSGEALSGAVVVAISQGSLWRYSETNGGFAVAVKIGILSGFDLNGGVGRHKTTFGADPQEWYRSIGASLRIASVRAGVRFTSTKLGLGSGYAVCVSYEPPPAHKPRGLQMSKPAQ